MSRDTRESSRQWRQNQKMRVLQAYNGFPGAPMCACCGEDNPTFLTIDHVKGGGLAHVRKVRKETGMTFYSWLKSRNFPRRPELQVLCYNCNRAKACEEFCPCGGQHRVV